MSKKFAGKFDAFGRVGLRDKDTKALISVYPRTVGGTDQEIESTVKTWYCQKSIDATDRIDNYYIDTLSLMELKNSQEKFED